MGCEGLWGILMTTTIIIITLYTVCPFEASQCVNGHLEDVALAISQFSNSSLHVGLAVGFVLAAAIFNGFGSCLTKASSALARTLTE